jgi:hypothetical protein
MIPDSLIVGVADSVTAETYLSTDWYPKAEDPFTDDLWRFQNVARGNYAFAVRAVDEAGAVMPDWDLLVSDEVNGGNVVKLDVNPAIEVHPYIDLTERNLLGTHAFRAYGEEWRVEVPVNVPLRFEWLVDATWYGSRSGGVNYALDIPDPGCEECKAPDGVGGWIGWGQHREIPFDIVYSADDAGEQHRLYIRARDESFSPEREMLAVVVMDLVAFSFDKTALWIDDFRTSGVNDCEHDAIISPVLRHAIAPHLRPGEDLEAWSSHRQVGECGESSALQEMRLSTLSRYKLLYWNVAGPSTALGDVTDPSPLADRGKYLPIYVRAGGNLIIWGRDALGHMLGDWFPNNHAYIPALPQFSGQPDIYPGTVPWDIFSFRTVFDRVGRGTLTSLKPKCSGMLGMQVTSKARTEGFPEGVPDPIGYDPNRTALWINEWYRLDDGPSPFGHAGVTTMTGNPPLRVAGMDTLYTYVSNSWSYVRDGRLIEACGLNFLSPFERKPIVVRYEDPQSVRGKVVWFGAPLHVFAENHHEDLKTIMRRLTDWILAS